MKDLLQLQASEAATASELALDDRGDATDAGDVTVVFGRAV